MDRTTAAALAVGGAIVALAVGGAAYAATRHDATDAGGRRAPQRSDEVRAAEGRTVAESAGQRLAIIDALSRGMVSSTPQPSARSSSAQPARRRLRGVLPGSGTVLALDASLAGERVVVAAVPAQMELGAARSRPRRGLSWPLASIWGYPYRSPGAGVVELRDGGVSAEVLDPRAAWAGGWDRVPRRDEGRIEVRDPSEYIPWDALELYAARLRGEHFQRTGRVRRVGGEDVWVYGAFDRRIRADVMNLREPVPGGPFDQTAQRVDQWLRDPSASDEERAERRRWIRDARATVITWDPSQLRAAVAAQGDCCAAGTCRESYGLPCAAVFAWREVFPVITMGAANLIPG